MPLQFQPAQSRQPDIVEHKAGRFIWSLAPQIFLRRRKRFDAHSSRPNQAAQRLTHRRVIIDHKHQRRAFGRMGRKRTHAAESESTGNVNLIIAPPPVPVSAQSLHAMRLYDGSADGKSQAKSLPSWWCKTARKSG